MFADRGMYGFTAVAQPILMIRGKKNPYKETGNTNIHHTKQVPT
jgi:hypothetical protein